MNFKLVSNYFKVVIACLLGGILLSHYLEPFQIKSFLKIRNMFYFSLAASKEMSDGIVYSKPFPLAVAVESMARAPVVLDLAVRFLS